MEPENPIKIEYDDKHMILKIPKNIVADQFFQNSEIRIKLKEPPPQKPKEEDVHSG